MTSPRAEVAAHPALRSSVAHSKGDILISRLDGTAYLVAHDVRIFRGITPCKATFSTGNQAPKRHRPIPSPTILALHHPGLSPPRLRRPDMITHQRPKTSPIFPREPMAEFPEDDAVQTAKQGRRVVGVLVKGECWILTAR